MTKIKLYKNGSAVGPRPSGPDDPVHGYRLVADDGKLLTRGDEYFYCVDVEISEVGLWKEVNASYS